MKLAIVGSYQLSPASMQIPDSNRVSRIVVFKSRVNGVGIRGWDPIYIARAARVLGSWCDLGSIVADNLPKFRYPVAIRYVIFCAA